MRVTLFALMSALATALQYRLLTWRNNATRFEELVAMKMKEGWQPLGGPSVLGRGYNGRSILYAQALLHT